MSFKQAKELSERLELSELTLKSTLDKMDTASKKFETILKQQKEFENINVQKDKKIINLKILIAINIGFIFGILVSKYFL